MLGIFSTPVEATQLPPLVSLDVSSISLALLVLGAYVCLIGQISYWLKEKLFISSALVSISIGIAFGPIGANWISPWKWTNYDDNLRNEITFQFCRLVIGVQVMFAGISLPAAYLRRQWRSITILLLPIMTIAWFVSAGLILAFIPGLTFLEALCISACVTPTDPILANAIVKGRYAEKNVPKHVRDIISAESGANDGLGYPFIFLPIFLMKRGEDSVSAALREWVVTTWIYQIIFACFLGGLIGYLARKSLKIAHARKLIDHESFLAYGIGLAFFTLGVVGCLGSDDVLAAFVAGNSLTWQDFYRIESEDDTFQDVIDGLLNASIFIYIGTLLPWSDFGDLSIPLTPWRLVVLSLLILAVRRLPWIMMLYPITPALKTPREALFAGWFGPIGVSAIYYALLAVRELPDDRVHLRTVIVPVVFFVALASTIAHGITIPLTKLGPHALTQTRSFSSFASTGAQTFVKRLRVRGRPVQPGDVSSPLRARLARNAAPSPPRTAGTPPTLSRSSSTNFRRGADIADQALGGTKRAIDEEEVAAIDRIEEGQGRKVEESPGEAERVSERMTEIGGVLSGVDIGRPPLSESILVSGPPPPSAGVGRVQFDEVVRPPTPTQS